MYRNKLECHFLIITLESTISTIFVAKATIRTLHQNVFAETSFALDGFISNAVHEQGSNEKKYLKDCAGIRTRGSSVTCANAIFDLPASPNIRKLQVQ